MKRLLLVEVTDRENRKTLSIPVDQEGLLSVSVLKQYFPGAVGLVYLGEDGKKEIAVLFDESMKKLLPPADGWNKIFYIFRPSISAGGIGFKRKRVDDGLPMDTQDEDLIVTHCREYMLYFLLERQSPGEFIEGSIIEGNFAKIPNGLALPCDRERYFILGYDAEYPHVSHLSCFSGRFRNTKIYANQSFVIGSPGTTDGCSGGGVFDQFGHLLGICVTGKLDWTNTRQPSYSHIVPAYYCMAIAKEILK
uniref:TAR DNA-binding protein 43 N-terminal domain-containing protein n=1 Tax=Acrobeloides nanus TaxID=290746 RepID=A0A914CTA7_9BILA